jgi:membrane associated rhomboid family serine protease
MIPIGDDNVRGARPAFVNYALIAINVIVFLYESTLPPNALQAFFNQWAVQPVEILAGQEWITLLTSMFLHGGWLHLIGNMVFLAVFGDNIEAVLGHLGYLIFYLIGGLAASAAHIFFNLESMIPSLGASGAIAAVLGAYLVLFPRSQVRALIFLGFFSTITRVSALLFLGIWFVTQLFSGIASLGPATAQTSGVAFWAHIGGFIAGLLGGYLLRGRMARFRYGGTF